MKLKQVVIRNFLSFHKATVNLLDRGLVSIEGKTEDKDGANSNGSGKSSLINAIMWCNYDDPGKKLKSVDEVVNSKFGSDCMVKCIWLDEDSGSEYTITRYRKHPKFKNAVTVEVGSTDITKGTNGETQLLINDILGADKSTFAAYCFARQEDAPDIPGMTDGELKALLENVLPVEQLAPLYKKAKDNVIDCENLVHSLELERGMYEVTLSNLKESIKDTQSQIDNWGEEAKAIRDASKSKLDALEKEKCLIYAELSTLNRLELSNRLEVLKLKADKYDKASYELIKNNWLIAADAYKKAKKELESVSNECPTCLREFEDAEQKIKIREANVERAIKHLKKIKPDYDKSQKQHDLYAKLLEAKLSLAGKISAYDDMTNDIVRIEKRIKELYDEKVRELTNPHLETMKRLHERRAKAATQLTTVEAQLEAERARLPILEAVAETYSPKGVRYHLLETLTPMLNDKTNYYLNQLTDGAIKAVWSTVTKTKAGEYREKFSIDVRGENFKSYGALSGGEKRKVKLACYFALQDVIAQRATKSISLWCGDEIDHALDPAGLERLMNVLHEKTATKSTILVISHNELREWIPNFTTVVKEDGISSIRGYLSE